MSKLQQIIEANLPKENDDSFQTSQSIRETTIRLHQKTGFNSCLAEIKKALPELEKAIVEEIKSQKFNIPNGTNEMIINDAVLDDLLTSLTKDNG